MAIILIYYWDQRHVIHPLLFYTIWKWKRHQVTCRNMPQRPTVSADHKANTHHPTSTTYYLKCPKFVIYLDIQFNKASGLDLLWIVIHVIYIYLDLF